MMCIFMGSATTSFPNPDDFDYKVPGTWSYQAAENVVVNGGSWSLGSKTSHTMTFNHTLGMVPKCGSKELKTKGLSGWLDFNSTSPIYMSVPTDDKFIMVKDPDQDCLMYQAPLALTMLIMILFSCFVQMAEGLHFGIVPYISRPALGVVSGMVGAGGNLGGFIGSKYIVSAFKPLDDGFIHLGITIVTLSLSMFFIYFPEHGSMLTGPKGMGSYDPQLIKPPENMMGADQLDYKNAKTDSVKV
jgi:NNP family nitrate/nitrite transporter-like MFS transporter